MKKKMALLLIALSAVLAAGTAVFLHAAHAGIKTLPPVQMGQDAARDMLRAALVYDEGTHTLRGTQTLYVTNRTEKALPEAVLRLYMNGQSEGCTVLAGVTADGESVKVTPDPDDPTVLRNDLGDNSLPVYVLSGLALLAMAGMITAHKKRVCAC